MIIINAKNKPKNSAAALLDLLLYLTNITKGIHMSIKVTAIAADTPNASAVLSSPCNCVPS